jgi:ribA/ribD-fused uncharacterized protein
MAMVARAWPDNKVSEDARLAVHLCFLNILNYPGASENLERNHLICVSPRKLRHIFKKIQGIPDAPAIYDRDSLIRYAAETPVTYLFFWGHQVPKDGTVTKSCLSQWYPAFFAINNIIYPTAEHYMMAEKARLFGDDEAAQKILSAQTAKEAKALGREIRGYDEDTWSQNRCDIVYAANYSKFSQNISMKEFLLSTGASVLVEASPVDPVWGIGLSAEDPNAHDPSKWKGQNLLGFILMKVRAEL